MHLLLFSPPLRSVGTNVSLHRDLFSSLPSKPLMPQRLEADDIINGTNSKLDHLDASLKQSLSISTPIVSSAHNSGFFVNGKCSVPIVEKARRVYVPKELEKRPSTANNLKDINNKQRKNDISSPINTKSKEEQHSRIELNNNDNEFSPLILDGYEKFAEESSNQNIDSVILENLNLDNNDINNSNNGTRKQKYNSGNNNNSNNNNGHEIKNVYKISEGLKNSQIIQSYDILFP